MQLYPHWLDGEFVRIASKADEQTQTIEALTRALKLHALLGTEFVLSDVQVFDSAAVLELFADPEFRAFVEGNREFLDLRVEPDADFGSTPFALAARGLTRTKKDGWVSSAFFGDEIAIKTLADEIIEKIQRQNCIQPADISGAERRYPGKARRLSAVRHAICYFGMHDTPKKLEAPIGERSNYYEVLKRTLRNIDSSSLFPQVLTDRKNIIAVIRFIDEHIPNVDDRMFRSKVLAILGREPNPDKQNLIWNNVVQAWSYATAQTIKPNGMSSGTLPHAVSPGPVRDSPMDVLVPFDRNSNSDEIKCIPFVPTLPCNLDEISWGEIGNAREATAVTMQELADVRAVHPVNIEAISDVLRRHVGKLGTALVPPKNVSKVTYALKFGDVVVTCFGSPEAACVKALGVFNDIYNDSRVKDRNALVDTFYDASRPH